MPTVLGTPASVTIQSTVFSSLRGNITQDMTASKISRSNQIDARYNSYAVCKSETYNPFLNLDHTVNREQGFLVYIPINNELQLEEMILSFSFHRPANLTGGFALRSRSLTTTKGFFFYFPFVNLKMQQLIEWKYFLFLVYLRTGFADGCCTIFRNQLSRTCHQQSGNRANWIWTKRKSILFHEYFFYSRLKNSITKSKIWDSILRLKWTPSISVITSSCY